MESKQQTTDKKKGFALNKSKTIYGSRRLVREKALQTLVAHFISGVNINLLIKHIFYHIFAVDVYNENDNNNSYSNKDIRLLSEEELINIDSDIMIKWKKEEVEFGKNIIFFTIKNYDDFVNYINDASVNWDFDRITIIDKTIIMIAITEFMSAPDIPIKVSINEALDLAKIYSTDKSPIFINGILEKIRFILEEKKLINKSERGMK
jgi:transcription antitermination factor NusB